MDDDTRLYIGDLHRTAEDHIRRARALLHEADILLGGPCSSPKSSAPTTGDPNSGG